MNKNRLEAFSDGVIAIIITIMVLELETPQSTDWSSLKQLIPIFLSYAISFVYVGIYWNNHHHLLYATKNINAGIMWMNLNLLFWLSLMPFATSWMGENNFEKNTVVLYAINLMICGISFTILQKVITKTHMYNESMKIVMKKSYNKGIISSIGYLISIPMAFIESRISFAIFIIVAIVWLIPDRNIEKALNE